MPILVLTDPFLSINAVDMSDHTKQVAFDATADMLDSTAGGNTTRQRLAGLKDWSVEADIEEDYAAASIDATLFPLIGAAPFAIEVRPVKTGGRSATNPGYSGNAVLENYKPVAGQHGQILMTHVILRGAGPLTRNIA